MKLPTKLPTNWFRAGLAAIALCGVFVYAKSALNDQPGEFRNSLSISHDAPERDGPLGGYAPVVEQIEPSVVSTVDDLLAGIEELRNAARQEGIAAIPEVGAMGKPCSVCGETAGEPLLATPFTGLGTTELSVSPIRAPEIRHAMSTWSLGQLEATARQLLTCRTRNEIIDAVTPLSTAMEQFDLPA